MSHNESSGLVMWSVATFIDHIRAKGEDGEQIYDHIRAQCQQVPYQCVSLSLTLSFSLSLFLPVAQ